MGEKQCCKRWANNEALNSANTSFNKAEEQNQIFMLSSETVFVESLGGRTDPRSGIQGFPWIKEPLNPPQLLAAAEETVTTQINLHLLLLKQPRTTRHHWDLNTWITCSIDKRVSVIQTSLSRLLQLAHKHTNKLIIDHNQWKADKRLEAAEIRDDAEPQRSSTFRQEEELWNDFQTDADLFG